MATPVPRLPSWPGTMPGPLPRAAPARRPGSVRRTTHLDVTRAQGELFGSGTVAVAGAARDLTTDAEGAGVAVGRATLAITLAEGRIATVAQDPRVPSLQDIVGLAVGFRFRSSVKDLLTTLDGTLLGALLDDVAGAPAPSGYASIRERLLNGEPGMPSPPPGTPMPVNAATQDDVCAGWRVGGVPTSNRKDGLQLPFEVPPVAPGIDVEGDDLAWHELGPLDPSQTRRLRRLDLFRADGGYTVDAMFRDSSVDPDGTPRVVHEYGLVANIDRDLVIREIVADPRALPFPTDCPFAAGSAAFLVDQPVADLRRTVRTLSAGPASCTHLNDLFRSLGDVTHLVHQLR
jgi:hypothetical protein